MGLEHQLRVVLGLEGYFAIERNFHLAEKVVPRESILVKDAKVESVSKGVLHAEQPLLVPLRVKALFHRLRLHRVDEVALAAVALSELDGDVGVAEPEEVFLREVLSAGDANANHAESLVDVHRLGRFVAADFRFRRRVRHRGLNLQSGIIYVYKYVMYVRGGALSIGRFFPYLIFFFFFFSFVLTSR